MTDTGFNYEAVSKLTGFSETTLREIVEDCNRGHWLDHMDVVTPDQWMCGDGCCSDIMGYHIHGPNGTFYFTV